MNFVKIKPPNFYLRNSEGIALVIAMYAFLFVSILTASILLLNQADISSIFEQTKDKKALYLADGGIEEGIYSLKKNGGFLWELGRPDYGPGSAHGGSGNCWGTQLKGDYFASVDQSLITPEITIPSTISNTLFLTFHRWVRTQDATDGAFVGVSFDGGITWSDVSCTSSKNWYNSQLHASSPYDTHEAANTAFGGCSSSLSSSVVWLPVTCNLSSAIYAGKNVFFRFYFWSNDSIQYQGIFIDNIRLCDGTPTSGACTEGTCTTTGNCTQGTCTTTIFSDNIEAGIGSWINLTVDYPESFGSAFVSVYAEEQTPEYDTYVLTSTGKLASPSHTTKTKAKISVHGETSPFTVKVHLWKRYF